MIDVDKVGVEPTTLRVSGGCSSTELLIYLGTGSNRPSV